MKKQTSQPSAPKRCRFASMQAQNKAAHGGFDLLLSPSPSSPDTQRLDMCKSCYSKVYLSQSVVSQSGSLPRSGRTWPEAVSQRRMTMAQSLQTSRLSRMWLSRISPKSYPEVESPLYPLEEPKRPCHSTMLG